MAHRRGKRALARTGKIKLDWVRKRDGDNCYICGQKTTHNTESSRRTGTARVLEHVVPIALGGEDTMFNVRIACRGCDQKKGSSADMVNIFALLQTFEPYDKESVLYKNVKPWEPPSKAKEPDGWWNYEDKPELKLESNAIGATQIASREQLRDWWYRDKGGIHE